jgi:hypothetical protein
MPNETKPTIAELEALLDEDGSSTVEILPDGQVVRRSPSREREPLRRPDGPTHY